MMVFLERFKIRIVVQVKEKIDLMGSLFSCWENLSALAGGRSEEYVI